MKQEFEIKFVSVKKRLKPIKLMSKTHIIPFVRLAFSAGPSGKLVHRQHSILGLDDIGSN